MTTDPRFETFYCVETNPEDPVEDKWVGEWARSSRTIKRESTGFSVQDRSRERGLYEGLRRRPGTQDRLHKS